MAMVMTRAVALACALLVSVVASGIPTKPDPLHTAPAVPWSSVPIPNLNPATDQHQHFDGSDVAGLNGAFQSYAVWDDFNFRFNAAQNRSLNKAADGQDWGHGFMATPARYCFDPSFVAAPLPGLPKVPIPFPPWAIPLVAAAEQTWESVNGPGFNVNKVPIVTLLQFVAAQAPNCDLHVRFDIEYPVGKIQVPFPDDSFDDEGHYNGNGPNGPKPGGGMDGVLAWWSPSTRELIFNSNINWYKIGNDKRPAAGANQFDFQSVALHEWGHVIGLDHGPGFLLQVNSTLTPSIGKRVLGLPPVPPAAAAPFGINLALDAGSIEGASVLYTIAKGPAPPQHGNDRPWTVGLTGGGAIELYNEPHQGLIGLTLARAVTPNGQGRVTFTPEVMLRTDVTTVQLPFGFQYDFALPVKGLTIHPRAALGYAASIASFSTGTSRETFTTNLGVFTVAAGLEYLLRERWLFGLEPLGFSVFFNGDGAGVVYRLTALVGVRL